MEKYFVFIILGVILSLCVISFFFKKKVRDYLITAVMICDIIIIVITSFTLKQNKVKVDEFYDAIPKKAIITIDEYALNNSTLENVSEIKEKLKPKDLKRIEATKSNNELIIIFVYNNSTDIVVINDSYKEYYECFNIQKTESMK